MFIVVASVDASRFGDVSNSVVGTSRNSTLNQMWCVPFAGFDVGCKRETLPLSRFESKSVYCLFFFCSADVGYDIVDDDSFLRKKLIMQLNKVI